MQSQNSTIFIGIKVNERLYDQLDSSKKSMKPFYKEDNPEYLQLVQIDNDEYIGKVAENGISIENLGNIFLNVKSMIKMICPQFAMAEDAIKIIALAPGKMRTYF